MTVISPVARLAVLGSIVRGMAFAHAARTAGLTVEQVKAIADAAGWPDIDAVRAEHTALRNAPGTPAPKRAAPPPRKASQKPEPSPAETPDRPSNPVDGLAAQVAIPDGLRSRDGAAALGRLLGEYFAGADEVIDAITPEETEASLTTLLAEQHANPYGLGAPDLDAIDDGWTDPAQLVTSPHPAEYYGRDPVEDCCDVPADVGARHACPPTEAEREYRGERVQTGPLPEHLEPLADYVARVGSPLVPAQSEALESVPKRESPQVSGGCDLPGEEVPAVVTPPSPMPAEYYGRDPSEPSPEDEAELDEEREFLARHGIDDDPAEAEPLVWDRTELIEEDNELTRVPLRPITQAEEDADTAAWSIPIVVDPEAPPGVVLLKDGPKVVATIVVDPPRALPPATDSPAPDPTAVAWDGSGVTAEVRGEIATWKPVELNPGVDLGPILPPAGNLTAAKGVKRSATRLSTVPCEGCGAGVLVAWVAANGGIQRHKHCREGS